MKNRIVAYITYFVFLVIVIFLYVFNNHPVTLLVLFATILFPIISIIFHLTQYKKIELSLRFDDSLCARNDSVHLVIGIGNLSWLPQTKVAVRFKIGDIHLPNDYIHEYTVFVPGHQTKEYLVPLHFSYCGVFVATIVDVTSYDSIDFIATRLHMDSKAEIVVLPSRIPLGISLNELDGSADEEEEVELAKKGDDPSEIFDFREYQPGDRLNAIHWKLTAKESEFIVKEFGAVTGEQFSVYVDNNYKDNRCKDALFDLLYSLCKELCDEKIFFSLYWWNPATDSLERRRIMTFDESVTTILELLYLKSAEAVMNRAVLSEFSRSRLLIVTTQTFKRNEQYRVLASNNNLARVYECSIE